MSKTYGYARISRATQKIERQIENISKAYPDADIRQEAYTGTKVEGRKELCKLLSVIEAGDTIVFDSVSRMSRNADKGIEMYFDLVEMGVNLVFLKEPYINTDVYRGNLGDKIELTGTDEDEIFKGLNNYFRVLAKKQIRIAFEQAEKEVTDLQQRTSEGLREAKKQGKQIGQKQGAILNVKKKEPIKNEIRTKAKDFGGTYSDKDLIKVLGIARNTFYKYKKELTEELQEVKNNGRI